MVKEYPFGLTKFYKAVYEAVDDPSLDSVISWGKNNDSFIIWNQEEFLTRVLFNSRMFSCRRYPQFFARLRYFGFTRFTRSDEHLEFGRKGLFVRGRPDLLKTMQRTACEEYMRKAAARAKQAKEKEVADRLSLLRI